MEKAILPYFSCMKLIPMCNVLFSSFFLFFYLNGFKSLSFMELTVVTIITVAVVAKITMGKAIKISMINM